MSAALPEPTGLPARQADPCVMVTKGAKGVKPYFCPIRQDPVCFIGQKYGLTLLGWSVITPVLDVWKALPPRAFPNYAAGSWGPKEADDLLARDGRAWRKIE